MPQKKKKGNKKPSKTNPALLAKIKQRQEALRLEKERIAKEEEDYLAKQLEEERLAKEEDIAKEKKKKEKKYREKERIEKLKKEGKYLTKTQRQKLEKSRARMFSTTSVVKKEVVIKEENDNKLNINDNMRSPICCVLGHVDTGKTKLLDKIRHTNVQDKEVGGITQQIGASYFPIDTIREKTKEVHGKLDIEYNLPGVLIIDTPGHESFSNLRHRGSSLCDIAILVIDVMHGLEKQTLESIKILKEKKIPFVIAVNKIDRIYGWKSSGQVSIRNTIKKQDKISVEELEDRIKGIKNELLSQGLNTEIFMKNHQMKKVYSLVPVSAITGEGIPDLLALMVFMTQKWMNRKLTLISDLECSIMEVKTEEGLGTTVDAILSNGTLKEGDKIIVATTNGPIITNIRTIMTPKPLKEMRIKDQYIHHKEIKASMGIKIVANDLENVVAGTSIARIELNDTLEIIEKKKLQVSSEIDNLLDSIKCSERGVYVKASTLGSLEAFVSLLKDEKIPIGNVSIGSLHKKDITLASTNTSLDYKEYSVILAFNIKVNKDVEKMAHANGIKIITGEIVYNIVDAYKKHLESIRKVKKEQNKDTAVFPCVVEMMGKKFIFNNKNPFVFGVRIIAGKLKLGTPLIVPSKNIVLGRVTSIEREHKKLEVGELGTEVCIKVETEESSITFGRQVTEEETLYSNITRDSIDCLKEFYKSDMKKEDWMLIIDMKKQLNIK
jgi:translation initiation factor 5B